VVHGCSWGFLILPLLLCPAVLVVMGRDGLLLVFFFFFHIISNQPRIKADYCVSFLIVFIISMDFQKKDVKRRGRATKRLKKVFKHLTIVLLVLLAAM
jgi:hypothetical protein